MRKLAIELTLPVTGQSRRVLGGLSSAGSALTMQYANLNQPQTIAAPTTVAPVQRVHRPKLQSILQAMLGAARDGAAAASARRRRSTGSAAARPASSSQRLGRQPLSDDDYSQCIHAAGGDVGKMQKCARAAQ